MTDVPAESYDKDALPHNRLIAMYAEKTQELLDMLDEVNRSLDKSSKTLDELNRALGRIRL